MQPFSPNATVSASSTPHRRWRPWHTLARLVIVGMLTSTANAQPLKPAIAGLAFLTGNWSSGAGRVSETGGRSTGSSSIVPAAGGAVLLRRDHTNLFDEAGHANGGFDQLMTIYAEGGAIHADYFDPQHVIHYTSAVVVPGKSAVFATAPSAGAPSFRLEYTLAAPGTLSVSFSIAPPGGSRFNPIATGTLQKTP